MKAIGLVEVKSVAKGIKVTDEMLKSAGVFLIQSGAVCPGKFVTIVGGSLSSIQASVDRAASVAEDSLIDKFVIGRLGEKVYAIGSPRGLENTFSSGEVSQWRDKNLMQISALIDHGSSGGALINEYGEVVGITSGSFADGSQANLNYAWSIDAIKSYIQYK